MKILIILKLNFVVANLNFQVLFSTVRNMWSFIRNWIKCIAYTMKNCLVWKCLRFQIKENQTVTALYNFQMIIYYDDILYLLHVLCVIDLSMINTISLTYLFFRLWLVQQVAGLLAGHINKARRYSSQV